MEAVEHTLMRERIACGGWVSRFMYLKAQKLLLHEKCVPISVAVQCMLVSAYLLSVDNH